MRRLPPDHRHRLEIDIGNSLKNADPKDPTQFWIWNVNLQYGQWIGRSSSLNAGVLFENDNSRAIRIENSDDPSQVHQRADYRST